MRKFYYLLAMVIGMGIGNHNASSWEGDTVILLLDKGKDSKVLQVDGYDWIYIPAHLDGKYELVNAEACVYSIDGGAPSFATQFQLRLNETVDLLSTKIIIPTNAYCSIDNATQPVFNSRYTLVAGDLIEVDCDAVDANSGMMGLIVYLTFKRRKP